MIRHGMHHAFWLPLAAIAIVPFAFSIVPTRWLYRINPSPSKAESVDALRILELLNQAFAATIGRMPLRFVILHHTGIASPHFDLMFEMEPDALLTTFRCPNWPPAPGEIWEELDEHRRAYLDYEGPVSGDRGHVRRVDAGTIDHVVLASDPPTLGLALDGQRAFDISISHHLVTGVDSATGWLVQTVEVLDETDQEP